MGTDLGSFLVPSPVGDSEAMCSLVEGYLGKDKKLYAAFMDLEKAYDRVDREALWSVLRIYGVGKKKRGGVYYSRISLFTGGHGT